MMRLRLARRDKLVAQGGGEGQVGLAVAVQMADFSGSVKECGGAEPARAGGDAGSGGNCGRDLVEGAEGHRIAPLRLRLAADG